MAVGLPQIALNNFLLANLICIGTVAVLTGYLFSEQARTSNLDFPAEEPEKVFLRVDPCTAREFAKWWVLGACDYHPKTMSESHWEVSRWIQPDSLTEQSVADLLWEPRLLELIRERTLQLGFTVKSVDIGRSHDKDFDKKIACVVVRGEISGIKEHQRKKEAVSFYVFVRKNSVGYRVVNLSMDGTLEQFLSELTR